MSSLSLGDPCSFSIPEECEVISMQLEWQVDFEKSIIHGLVHLTVEKKNSNVESLILDTRDLAISQISEKSTGQVLSYTLGLPISSFGSKLQINLPSTTEKKITMTIAYSTSPQCSALQWLKPEQTAGKQHPYLFSQCQAIHARSLVPCQDTSAVKFPFSATVSAPSEITVLMSAVRLGDEPCENNSRRIHRFEQKVPIPSYLIAIVAGKLESRDIGPRSKVWSEKELVEKAAYEFAETEKMLQTAESLLGPYVWGQYDLLVLPPSFPYGGMENPCLTFVTPTLLAGDRSLADVVAHEISHSWTGNLVTNKNPEHFWLNEGHTMFVERKLVSQLHGQGEAYRHFHAITGWKDLEYVVELLGKDDPSTMLVPDLKGVDPDDAFSIVPYEKGFTFLFYLESLLGGPEAFNPFLKAYIEKFKYQSIDTATWKEFLLSYFRNKVEEGALKSVDWEAWFHGVGMPPVKPIYDDSLAVPCRTLCEKWSCAKAGDFAQFSNTDLKSMSSLQVREFLNLLQKEVPLSEEAIEAMVKLYQLNDVKNSELKFRWLRLCLRAEYEGAIPLAIDFVNEQGRMKFVRPIYRDLYNWEKARETAIKNFKSHRQEMHNTTASLVEKDLKLV